MCRNMATSLPTPTRSIPRRCALLPRAARSRCHARKTLDIPFKMWEDGRKSLEQFVQQVSAP